MRSASGAWRTAPAQSRWLSSVRFVAPGRAAIDPIVFARPPLSLWTDFSDLLQGTAWPAVAALNERAALASGRASSSKDGVDAEFAVAGTPLPRFVVQSPALLRDGLHYEQRIAEGGQIATRERNWHDLLNALVWLRFPELKAALNARQVAEIAVAGPKRRTLAQCALTHFDEAGVVVSLRDPALLELWDAHDWHGLFWRERAAWSDGRIEAVVFGHALLEHALKAEQLLVGKAVAVVMPQSGERDNAPEHCVRAALGRVAAAVRSGLLMADPQEMRPLPLSGIPGWHPANRIESFYREAPCFRPLRSGRCYPAPLHPA